MATQLNPSQRAWIEKFLAKHPSYCKSRVSEGVGPGHRIILLTRTDSLPLPVVEEKWGWHGYGCPGVLTQELSMSLMPSGSPTWCKFSFSAVYPHCPIRQDHYLSPRDDMPIEVQMALPLTQVLSCVGKLKSPLIVKGKFSVKPPKKPKVPKPFRQLSLPVSEIGQQLLEIHLTNSEEDFLSEENLLSGTVPFWSEKRSSEVQIPKPFADLLNKVDATYEEWESAIALQGVQGNQIVLDYIQGIPFMREYYKKYRHPGTKR